MGNYLFITGNYPKELYKEFELSTKVMLQEAANVLSWRIIEGFDENSPNSFSVLTCPFIGYYPRQYRKAIIHDRSWSHSDRSKDYLLGFLNIKGIETIIKSERIYRFVKKWYREDLENRNILFYSHYAGFMRAAGKIKKSMPDMNMSCIVTDMPEVEAGWKMGQIGKRTLFRDLMFTITYKNMKYLSSVVVLAPKMMEYLPIPEKPYAVVDGIADTKRICSNKNGNSNKFVIVYNGTLQRKSGIIELASAFSKLPDNDIELHISGFGNCDKELKEMGEKDKRIHFHGTISHEEVLHLQDIADLLVNPRPEEGITTSLFFPSKTMEYMAAGKAVMCFKLPCIASEYDDVLLYFSSFSVESMAKDLSEVKAKGKEYLINLGRKCRSFVDEKKSGRVQVGNIINLMESANRVDCNRT